MTRQSRQGNTSQKKTSSVRQNKPAVATPTQAPLQRAILQMQRTYGNQATTRALTSQLKAAQRMGGGPEEEELQLKANPAQRMGGPEEEELQLKADPAQRMGGSEEEELQMKADPAQRNVAPDEEELQMKAAAPVQRKSGGANKMPEHVQSKMETAFHTDFSDVNIHVGSQATDVGALAYAQGNDIHFAQGKFDPESRSGQELLGHELAHVVQQRAGRVQPTTEANGLPINDDPKLEQEADNLGRQAASLKLEE
ncbi:MAG: DUF4157 domain-containing protein [Tumebacillaceae bacterium]